MRQRSQRIKNPAMVMIFVVVVSVVMIPDITFAQGLSEDLNGWVINAIRMMSWLWIIPASIAGKLMTNSMAFGSAFYLDAYLFKMWQFMRTMALYALGFIFIFKILVVFFKQEELKNIGGVIAKTAIAGLLISMSWFMITALVDFSIVATSAVAGMPLQVMKEQWDKVEKDLWCYKQVKVKDWKVDTLDINKESNKRKLSFDDVMPSGDSVAGPMVFMGCGMLNIFDFNNISESTTDFSDISFYNGIKFIIAGMLILPMIILMVVNMMRIFFIWLRAMFGPLIVLDTVFGGPLTKEGSAYGKYFKVSNIIGLVFQPVAVVGLMSVSMVLLIGFYSGLTGQSDDVKEEGGLNSIGFYQTEGNGGIIGTGVNSEVHMTGSLFDKSTKVWAGGILGEMIMAMLVIIVMRGLMKAGFQSSSITSGVSDKMFELGKMGAKAIPFVPTPMGGQSIAATQKAMSKFKDNLATGLGEQRGTDVDRINQMFGLSIKDKDRLDSTQEAALKNTSGNHYGRESTDFLRKMKEVQQTNSIPRSVIKPNLERWLVEGGFAALKRNRAQLHGMGEMPEDISSIWNTDDGRNIMKWFNALMKDPNLKGEEANQDFFKIKNDPLTRHRINYEKVSSNEEE